MNIVNLNVNSEYSKYLLIMLNNPQQICLKLLQKEQFKKQQKELVIWLVVTLLIKLQKFQKIHNTMIQTQLQMRIIKKYLKKDICLQKKDKIVDEMRLINLLDNTPNQPTKFRTNNLETVPNDHDKKYQ